MSVETLVPGARKDGYGFDVKLRWHGPFQLASVNNRSIFRAPEGAEAGIFVWAARTAIGLLPHYVGETADSFAQRHLDHSQAYARGVYSTHDADAFALGHEVVLQEGTYWRRVSPSDYQPLTLLSPNLRIWQRAADEEALHVECHNPPAVAGFPTAFEA